MMLVLIHSVSRDLLLFGKPTWTRTNAEHGLRKDAQKNIRLVAPQRHQVNLHNNRIIIAASFLVLKWSAEDLFKFSWQLNVSSIVEF